MGVRFGERVRETPQFLELFYKIINKCNKIVHLYIKRLKSLTQEKKCKASLSLPKTAIPFKVVSQSSVCLIFPEAARDVCLSPTVITVPGTKQ